MYNEQYLMHYGVPGMKWGVRKAVKYTSTAVRSDVTKAAIKPTAKRAGQTAYSRFTKDRIKNSDTPYAERYNIKAKQAESKTYRAEHTTYGNARLDKASKKNWRKIFCQS